MGKRIYRFFKEEIITKANELIGFKAMVILNNNQTLAAQIISIGPKSIIILIKFGVKKEILLESIQEIEIDKSTAW